jgi:acetyl esterase/lipase
MMKRITVTLTILLITQFTFRATAQDMSEVTRADKHVLLNISYGNDARQKMDVYFPPEKSASTRMMVIVHGGAWVRGDKSEYTPYIASLQRLLPDYAFANINYRLFRNGKNPFPAQEEDMRAAITYLRSKINVWGISDKMVLLGASAGGHLALLQAYKPGKEQAPAAVISFFGPTDLREMYEQSPNPDVKPMLANIVTATPQSEPGLYNNASPVRFVTRNSPPTFILQGGRDQLVDEKQALLLERALVDNNVPYELKIYPEEGHGWRGPALYDSFLRVAAFLKKYVP